MSKSAAICPGASFGYLEVVAVMPCQFTGLSINEQQYACRKRCCGAAVTRSHKVLLDHKRRPRRCCPHCLRLGKAGRFRAGATFGPVQVVRVISPNQILVRWACCGEEKIASAAYLDVLRHDAGKGLPLPLHRRCQQAAITARRAATLAKTDVRRKHALPSTELAPATAWPRPASLRVSA